MATGFKRDQTIEIFYYVYCSKLSLILPSHGKFHLDSGETNSYYTAISIQFMFLMNLLTPLGNKPFENTVGKGEIARDEQFLLFPQCFQRTYTADT